MLRFLPAGWIGLMVGGLIAANSSTILSHLNWGASYLVHDFYRRFLKPSETEKHYVFMGRMATVLLFVVSSALVFVLQTAQETSTYSAGRRRYRPALSAALVLVASDGLVRNCRHAQFISDLGFLPVLARNGHSARTDNSSHHHRAHHRLLGNHRLSRPQTDPQTLIDFYQKVRPFGPGWTPVRIEAGIIGCRRRANWDRTDNIPLAMLGWVSGSF